MHRPCGFLGCKDGLFSCLALSGGVLPRVLFCLPTEHKTAERSVLVSINIKYVARRLQEEHEALDIPHIYIPVLEQSSMISVPSLRC